MPVDLARNDVNYVCDPTTRRIDRLMVIQKVSDNRDALLNELSGRSHHFLITTFSFLSKRLLSIHLSRRHCGRRTQGACSK